jgi:hypothetical protein
MVWKEWASGCCSQRAHPWCPRHRRWRRQGWREDRVDLLQRKTVGESIRVHPWCPCRRRWRRHGWRKGWVDLLRRKTVGESAGQHGRLERLLYVDPPPPTRPYLNGASLGVEVEGPRAVAIVAVRGGGGGVEEPPRPPRDLRLLCHRR